MRRVATGYLVSMSQHLKPLAGLWSAGMVTAGMNFLATLLIIAQTPAYTYASYTVALSILMLSAGWTDGGLSGTLSVLAVQPGNEREKLALYRRVGRKYAWRIVPVAYLVVVGIALVILRYSQVFRGQTTLIMLAAFGAIGIASSRAAFYGSLLHACGKFRQYNIVQVSPPVMRILLIGVVLSSGGSLSFDVLLGITLIPAVFGWGLAAYLLHVTFKAMPSNPGGERETEVDRQVKRFLKPTLYSVVLNALIYNVTVLGASFFTGGVAIAAFGVFLRLNTIITMMAHPLNGYVARRLRLAPTSQARRKAAIHYIVGFTLGFIVYIALASTVYRVLGTYLHHYSLDYPLEFLIFLLGGGLGSLYVILDLILASSGDASHRYVGALLFAGLNTLLIPILRPSSLLTMVVISAVSVLPALLYYNYRFVRLARGEIHDIQLENAV